MSIVKIQKLRENAVIPTRGSEKAAGYDLYAAIPEDAYILPHTTMKIKTGLAMELPDNTFGAIFARSGLATKQGLRPANCVGVCDSDYRGEYMVALHNDTDTVQVVVPGEKIAQLILLPFLPIEFNMVDELSETERGEGGFGSTGL
jgi:dUTP pyrophosphatase